MEILEKAFLASVSAVTQPPALLRLVAFGSARAQKCFAHGTDSILVGESHHFYERMNVFAQSLYSYLRAHPTVSRDLPKYIALAEIS